MADEFKFDLQRFADGGTKGDKGEKGTPDAPENKTKEEQEAIKKKLKVKEKELNRKELKTEKNL